MIEEGWSLSEGFLPSLKSVWVHSKPRCLNVCYLLKLESQNARSLFSLVSLFSRYKENFITAAMEEMKKPPKLGGGSLPIRYHHRY
jgi:hypothetical protein